MSWGASHAYRKWRIDPGRYRVVLVGCFQQMRLRLLDATGQQELAASALAATRSCPELS